MNTANLTAALRKLAGDLNEQAFGRMKPSHSDLLNAAELVRVLARTINGVRVERAFGAPGDWGYNTPIGAALAAKEE